MQKINVCISCDDGYAPYAGVVIVSALLNSNFDEYLDFYILEDSLSDENKKKLKDLEKIKPCSIKFVTVPLEYSLQFKNVRTLGHITHPAYFRLKISELLPDIERILYLDCDVMVQSSLKEMYFSDFGNNYCAGVRDFNLGKKEFYINSGVLLINLKKWRDENVSEKIEKYIEENHSKIVMGDQQIINDVFRGRILELPKKWNLQILNFYSFSSYAPDFCVVHFIGTSKPWVFGSFMPFKKRYFEYLSKTPWEIPDKKRQFVSNLYSYLRYFKRRPFFFIRLQFFCMIVFWMRRFFREIFINKKT